MPPSNGSLSCIRTMFVIIFWVLLGTQCKPLQQQSNDRLSIDGDSIALNEMTPSDSDVRLEKLSRTMDALTQFREMLNNRLLTNNGLSENSDANSDGALLVEAENAQVQKNQYKNHNRHHRKHQRPQSNDAVDKQYQRKQRGDESESPSNTYQISGLQIKAHLQPGSPPSSAGGQGGTADEQRFLTGKTTAIDGQQLRLFSELPTSDAECPRLHGQTTQVMCPSRRRHGYRICIPDTALCNDQIDCPNGEDEDPINCLFYKTTIHHFRLVVDAVVDLSDLIKQQEKRRNSDEL